VEFVAGSACTADGTCLLVGSNARRLGITRSAAVALSADGGASWSAVNVPALTVDGHQVPSVLDAISCVGNDCVAAGSEAFSGGHAPIRPSRSVPMIIRSTDGGRTWTIDAGPEGLSGSGALACGRGGWCVLAGQASAALSRSVLAVSTDLGQTWTVERALAPAKVSNFEEAGIACSSPRLCLVVLNNGGGNDQSSIQLVRGNRWQAEPTPAWATTLSGIACEPSGVCFVAGSIGVGGSVILRGRL